MSFADVPLGVGWGLVRIPRWSIVLSAGAVSVALAALVASVVLVSSEPTPGLSPSPTPSPSPSAPLSETEVALREVMDSERQLEDRTLALKRLSQSASDAGPIVRILRQLPGDSPSELQVRAMALTALERFPRDLAAREYLVVLAFTRTSERSERTLALDVLASRPDLADCRKPLAVLTKDPEPAVASRARKLLDRLGPVASPTPR